MIKKLKDWQERDLRELENLLSDDDFVADIARLKAQKNEPIDLDLPYVGELLKQYGLPFGVGHCLVHYIATDKLDPTLIEPSILLISDKDKTIEPTHLPPQMRWYIYENLGEAERSGHLKIVIRPETTRLELEAFIETYAHLIEKRRDNLTGNAPKRKYKRRNAKRDNLILRLHRGGLKSGQIAKSINDDPSNFSRVDYAIVRQVISREKKRRAKRDN